MPKSKTRDFLILGLTQIGGYGVPANYLKGEAKCICSELFLYADFFHCGLLNRLISNKIFQTNKSCNMCEI